MIGRLIKFVFETPEEDASTNLLRESPEENNVVDWNLQDEFRDCVLVLDCSGSMGSDDWPPSRLEGAKEASRSFCSRLASENPESRVAIVSYGSSATLHCELTPARRTSEIERAIESISLSGSTNIRAGLSKASEILSRSNGMYCQVVLLSDGLNTQRDPRRRARALRSKATIDCVGIGGQPSDVDENLMKDIASPYPDGSKRYRWIGDKKRLIAHFHNLAGRISRT